METWKDVKGFEGKYFVSSFGRVKNNTTVLKPHMNKNGYCTVRLYKDGKHYPFYIHRLVMEHFSGCEGNFEVNHKDGNKNNNKLSNLEVVSHKENCYHRSHVLGITVCKRCGIINCDTGERFKSLTDAAKSVNRSVQAMHHAISHNTRCGGYKFDKEN